MVEAEVAIESDEMRRGVDGLDFASAQVLRAGGVISYRFGADDRSQRDEL